MMNTESNPPPVDATTPQERLAGQDWTGVAKIGLSSMAPAEKGWILAVVIIIAVLEASDYFTIAAQYETIAAQYESFQLNAKQIADYLNVVEEHRKATEENRSQEIRRMQEVNKELSQALGRSHEYEGRAQHERDLLEEKSVKP